MFAGSIGQVNFPGTDKIQSPFVSFPGKNSGSTLEAMAGNFVDNVNKLQIQAEASSSRLAIGEAESIHKVMIDLTEAQLALQMAVQIRNKALEAYQEVMRMQI